MRRVARVAVWAAVFLGAAGVGAYIAAHSELFPPEVQTAGATGSPDPSTRTPSAEEPHWSGVIRSESTHELYVGGGCTTDWVTTFSFDALDNGRIVGGGTARLQGDRRCTFPNAQVNAERIEVSIEGTWSDDGFRIRLRDGDRSPRGTADYGGFAPTVFDERPAAEMDVPLNSPTRAAATIRIERVDDQGRGTYRCTNRVSLTLDT